MKLKLLGAVVAAVITCATAAAAPILDASFDGGPRVSSSIIHNYAGYNVHAAQTFTALNSGRLESIGVKINDTNQGFLRLAFREQPTGPNLAVFSPPVGTGKWEWNFVDVDTSAAGLFLTSGRSYAIVLFHDAPTGYSVDWASYSGKAYDGGAGYLSVSGYPFTPTNSDYDFRVMVDPSIASTPAVPEPATWAMMIGGFGMVGGAMRSARRKQKVSVSYA